jgi:DNA-binding transcriptional LysR family regulator
MDIDRIRYFHVFAETGSLVRASEILHISQPALSKALRVLANELDLELIEPDGRGLRLTETGLRFRAETQNLLKDWLNLPNKLKFEKNNTIIKIGSFEVFTTYFLGYLMNYLKLENLEIHEHSPGSLENAIRDHRVDVGITYLPVPQQGVEFIEVTKIKMGVYGLPVFAKDNFSQLPFVVPLLPAEGTPSKVIGLDGWPDHKYERNIKFRVTMMESALELCRKGHAVAFLPEFVVKLQNEDLNSNRKLIELESKLLQKDRTQSVFLIYRKGSKETSLHKQIARCLRTLK